MVNHMVLSAPAACLLLLVAWTVGWKATLVGAVPKLKPVNLPTHCTNLKTNVYIYARNSQQYGFPSDPANVKPEIVPAKDDNGFEIRVRRASDWVMVSGWYEPGRKYIVTLTNRYQMTVFRDAIMWLQPALEETQAKMHKGMPVIGSSTSTPNQTSGNCDSLRPADRLGKWVHLTSSRAVTTQSRPGCAGLTVERFRQSRVPVMQMVAVWSAPENRFVSRTVCAMPLECVTIYAAVYFRGSQQEVLSHAGGLMKTLCPAMVRPPSPVLPAYMTIPSSHHSDTSTKQQASESHEDVLKMSAIDARKGMDNMQPQDCCACGGATYNLTFTGLWTRKTHPRDWPVHNPGLLHWTNLIGASHMPSYHIYQFGETASAGVSAVCAYGDTTVLKQSLGVAATNTGSFSSVPTGTQRGAVGLSPIHSLVSAPGMWSEETLGESRSTLVGVNRTHPLISFLTMLGPSPNWCAGLTSQSVCQADCTWAKLVEIDLYPWDAGIRHGDTYVPKDADRKDIPDPIRYITDEWMPNHPFTRDLPVAHVRLERVLPKHSWQCTSELANGVTIFQSDGTTVTLGAGDKPSIAGEPETRVEGPISSVGDSTSTKVKKSRGKSSAASASGGGGAGLAGDNPLADPSLAQMATFLCITDTWSAWSPCSVTCGVGRKERHRLMLVNKKNELCQHVPLKEEDPCEGRKRTCDFTSPCSILPWTEWTPCNATCANREGVQSRRRYLARQKELNQCSHLFKLPEERKMGMILETRKCAPSDSECDPVTICGEGRKDGSECGPKVKSFYYSSVDHACLPFDYLGCKGGRNRFSTKTECESACLKAVESLPAWRRERMALLQFQTSQITNEDASMTDKQKSMQPATHCSLLMDPGEKCNQAKQSVRWYFSSRTRRCNEFVYLGCGGNANRYDNYTLCLSDCRPEEWEKSRQMARALAATSVKNNSGAEDKGKLESGDTSDDPAEPEGIQRLNNLWGPTQDCQLSSWSGWGPCSALCAPETGKQMRWRYIERPARHGGVPCGMLFDEQSCVGREC